ncbi:hypothetical protein FA15DRAFT_605063 [Coprinopsis marcescibilis]|uniref:Uncharacterized protein n=1 Tax=Coprinopsis marcescibilis TaxID=230819 RepID=A0A5C3KCR2_COPMA|nr:hypothetical protein FA15DRAFT_605063 [Coprinopsis marcescibilis]
MYASSTTAKDLTRNGSTDIADVLINNTFQHDRANNVFAYKHVANRIKPVPGTMPEQFNVHWFPPPVDPMTTLPLLLKTPPDFVPGERLTAERMEQLGMAKNSFLLEEERKLAMMVLTNNEMALAFDELQKGRFRLDMFPELQFAVLLHVPWAEPSNRIPLAIEEKVMKMLKDKVDAGTYEPSTSSYCHQWFCVGEEGWGCLDRAQLGATQPSDNQGCWTDAHRRFVC